MSDIEGTNDILKALAGLYDPDKLQKALVEACAIVEADAKKNAPKDTGALKRSIATEIQGNEGIVYTPLEYAPYIEYGTGLFAESDGRMDVPWNYQDDKGEWHRTSGQKPQPFLRPALNDNRTKIVDKIKEALKDA